MWSSGVDNHSNNKKKNNNNSNGGHGGGSRIVSSSSSKSSPSSTSSILLQTPRRRTMEDVWKDINLTTLHHEMRLDPLPESHYHSHHHHDHHPAMILQDFLSASCFTVSRADAAVDNIPLPPPLPLLPPTALSLNSGLELQYLGNRGGGGGGSTLINGHSRSSSNSNGSRVNGQANSSSNNNGRSEPFISPSFSDAIIAPPSPAGFFSFGSKKRMMPEGPGSGSDRRHKRMIKNRESAARSRARKQAYTNELELEVSHLLEENAKLKKQLEELRLAMDAQLPNRIALKRSSSAPF